MLRDPPAEEVLALCRLGHRGRAIVDGLARDPSLASDGDATIAAALQGRTADVDAVFGRLAAWGWVSAPPGGGRRMAADRAAMTALSHRLRGMLEAQALAERVEPEVVPIATLPESSVALRGALGDVSGTWFETRDGFAHVAARARDSLVFLVPFMDATGAEAVADMLGRCQARRKVVVARPDSRGVRHHLRFADRLAAAGAELREYWLPRADPGGPAAETFHAKLVVADRHLVYVGSSNLMASSLDGGLECGVLLEGAHARPFCRLVEAVLSISSPGRGAAVPPCPTPV